MAANSVDAEPRPVTRYRELLSRDKRATTLGVLLLITLLAFENMGVGTAMPTIVASLHGNQLYAWPFIAFLIASVLATALSGRLCDSRGPSMSLLLGPAMFTAGLVIAGLARNMPMLLAGRALQGLGTGTLIVAVYLVIALVYEQRERPLMFAANAAAWVLPALVGPAIAGLVTERFGWRWVFLGLLPLVAVGIGLLIVVVRRLGPHVAAEQQHRAGVLAAVAAAVSVAVVTWAAGHPSWPATAYGGVALVALGVALYKLLPMGTLRGRRGLPTVVGSRALLGGAFAAMEAFLPLTMTAVHDYRPALAGLPLTVSALGWSAGSMFQGRHPDWSRQRLLRAGFLLVAAGLGLFALVSQTFTPGWLAFVAGVVGGAGMGIAYPAISVLLLHYSPVPERGFNTSAMHLGDSVAAALVIGLGGVLLGALASAQQPGTAVAVLALTMVAVAAIGVSLTSRWPESAP